MRRPSRWGPQRMTHQEVTRVQREAGAQGGNHR